jgi:hypothetical protein
LRDSRQFNVTYSNRESGAAGGVLGAHERATRLAGTRHLCIILALFLSGACSDEVARVRSPNGLTDAVLMVSGGNATVSPGYDIVLTRAGGSSIWGTDVAGLYAAVRSDSAYGVNLRWPSNDSLRIEFLRAQTVNKFTPSVKIHNQTVFVSLDSGIADLRAPAGGMLYNQQRMHH